MSDTLQVEDTQVFVSEIEINKEIDSDVETLRKKIKQDMEETFSDITKVFF